MRLPLSMLTSLFILALAASGCKPTPKPVEDGDGDPCADGGVAGDAQGGGKVVCDGLDPIEDGLGGYLDGDAGM